MEYFPLFVLGGRHVNISSSTVLNDASEAMLLPAKSPASDLLIPEAMCHVLAAVSFFHAR